MKANWGSFPLKLTVEMLDDGRKIKLLSHFAYTDPELVSWWAKQGAVVDGASIPRVFWTIAGGPLEGKYRKASVVHDVYCVSRDKPWQDVHRMFYNACRCGGLAERWSKILYAAVYHFGPRWSKTGRLLFKTRDPDWDMRNGFAKYVDDAKPSLEDIENADPNYIHMLGIGNKSYLM